MLLLLLLLLHAVQTVYVGGGNHGRCRVRVSATHDIGRHVMHFVRLAVTKATKAGAIAVQTAGTAIAAHAVVVVAILSGALMMLALVAGGMLLLKADVGGCLCGRCGHRLKGKVERASREDEVIVRIDVRR